MLILTIYFKQNKKKEGKQETGGKVGIINVYKLKEKQDMYEKQEMQKMQENWNKKETQEKQEKQECWKSRK